MRKIKIAQIGTSQCSHGNEIFRTLIRNADMFEIVGYHMPEHEREKFPDKIRLFDAYRELSLEEILEDPDVEAVTVETEEIYLSQYALLAAQHKKHIHMEKPGGVETSLFEALIETVKKNQTVFHTGYMYRYNPYIRELKDEIKKGEFGEIISVEAQMNCIHPKEVRDWLKAFPGGMMFFLGCHLVDLIYSIQGAPKRVIPLNKCSHTDGVTAEDFGMAVFEYENGISFAKTSAVELGGFERRQLVVSGTKKTVELKPLEWMAQGEDQYTERYVRESQNWHDVTPKTRCTPFNRYDSMMRSFGEMVTGEKENPWDPDYELALYRLIQKACGVE